ncbi:MAG TPA: RidA family protein [Rhodocyclaceae bacterium]|nr:RidA family protein [Rhodocyclaceae bacterium]
MEFLQPLGWARPKGYSNGVAAAGRMVVVAGQVGWDEQEVFRTDDLVGQARQALTNVVGILAQAGARPTDIVRMNWYLADKEEYNARLAEIGEAYRDIIGRHFPAMTALQVAGFVEAGAKVEIEVTAMVPPDADPARA